MKGFNDEWQPSQYLLSPYDSMEVLISVGCEETVIAELVCVDAVDKAITKMLRYWKREYK